LGLPLLLLAVFPWLLRMGTRKVMFRSTSLDIPMALFVTVLLLGWGLSYSFAAAAGKFWVLVGGIFLYFAIAQQSRRDLWLVAAAAGPVAAVLTVYFLLAHDWRAWPAEIAVIDSVWRVIDWVRPSLPIPTAFHPNLFSGIISMLIPFSLAFARRARTHRLPYFFRITILSLLIAAGGLLLTSAVWSWFGLAVGLLVGVFLTRRVEAPAGSWMKHNIWLPLLLVGAVSGSVVIFFFLEDLLGNQGRIRIFRQTLFLIRDFSISGSGLASFPALYAQYIRVIPFYFIPFSNLYLDVWLELGPAGLLLLLFIWGWTGWRLLRALQSGGDLPVEPPVRANGEKRVRRHGWRHGRLIFLPEMRRAALVAWLVMILQSLFDDVLYGGMGTPFLFFVPAVTFVVTRQGRRERRVPKWVGRISRTRLLQGGAAALAVIAVLVVLNWPALVVDWQANRVSLGMARLELTGWPTGQWDDGGRIAEYAAWRAALEKSVAGAPNQTAYYRLGWMAMLERDYETAVTYLEEARALTTNHRGVRKSLGYSYLWTGDYEKAHNFLRGYFEITQELSTYQDWWAANDHPELAVHAQNMLPLLPARR
jgi:hypothetical protein